MITDHTTFIIRLSAKPDSPIVKITQKVHFVTILAILAPFISNLGLTILPDNFLDMRWHQVIPYHINFPLIRIGQFYKIIPKNPLRTILDTFDTFYPIFGTQRKAKMLALFCFDVFKVSDKF